RNRDGGDIGIEDLQRQVGAGESAGNRNADMLQVVDGKPAAGDDHGTVALAHAAAAAHQQVIALDVGIGVKADGGYVEEGFVLRSPVECLDVTQSVREPESGNANLAGGHAVEHESVVGVGTVRDGNIKGRGGNSADVDMRWLRGQAEILSERERD